jgi:hypothetical protein
MGLRPTQGDEKRLLFSGTAIPPPCHPDRSAAQWRDLRFGGSFLEMFFDRSEVEESTVFFPGTASIHFAALAAVVGLVWVLGRGGA